MEFSSQNTGVGSLSLLQGIFPTEELNQGFLHCRQILYQLSYQGSPNFKISWVEVMAFNQARAIVAHEGGGLVFVTHGVWFLQGQECHGDAQCFRHEAPLAGAPSLPGDQWTPPAPSPQPGAILPGKQSKPRGRSFAAGSSTARRPQRAFLHLGTQDTRTRELAAFAAGTALSAPPWHRMRVKVREP